MNITDLKLFTAYYIEAQDKLKVEDKITMLEFVSDASKEQVMSFLLTGKMRELEEGEDKFVTELFELTSVNTILNEADIPFTNKSIVGLSGKKGLDSLIKKLAGTYAQIRNPEVRGAVFHTGLGGSNSKTGGFAAVMGGNKEDVASFMKNYENAQNAIKAGGAVSAAVLVAMIALLGKKIYKSTFSKAAKACRKTKGVERNECFRKFHSDAIKARIDIMNKSKNTCQATKNPGQCVAKVDQRINKEKIKLQKIMSKKKVR